MSKQHVRRGMEAKARRQLRAKPDAVKARFDALRRECDDVLGPLTALSNQDWHMIVASLGTSYAEMRRVAVTLGVLPRGEDTRDATMSSRLRFGYDPENAS